MLFAIVFGLSMDYEVFLVSRDPRGVDAQRATPAERSRHGLASTGRVITAAATIMICVFLSFVARWRTDPRALRAQPRERRVPRRLRRPQPAAAVGPAHPRCTHLGAAEVARKRGLPHIAIDSEIAGPSRPSRTARREARAARSPPRLKGAAMSAYSVKNLKEVEDSAAASSPGVEARFARKHLDSRRARRQLLPLRAELSLADGPPPPRAGGGLRRRRLARAG